MKKVDIVVAQILSFGVISLFSPSSEAFLGFFKSLFAKEKPSNHTVLRAPSSNKRKENIKLFLTKVKGQSNCLNNSSDQQDQLVCPNARGETSYRIWNKVLHERVENEEGREILNYEYSLVNASSGLQFQLKSATFLYVPEGLNDRFLNQEKSIYKFTYDKTQLVGCTWEVNLSNQTSPPLGVDVGELKFSLQDLLKYRIQPEQYLLSGKEKNRQKQLRHSLNQESELEGIADLLVNPDFALVLKGVEEEAIYNKFWRLIDNGPSYCLRDERLVTPNYLDQCLFDKCTPEDERTLAQSRQEAPLLCINEEGEITQIRTRGEPLWIWKISRVPSPNGGSAIQVTTTTDGETRVQKGLPGEDRLISKDVDGKILYSKRVFSNPEACQEYIDAISEGKDRAREEFFIIPKKPDERQSL